MAAAVQMSKNFVRRREHDHVDFGASWTRRTHRTYIDVYRSSSKVRVLLVSLYNTFNNQATSLPYSRNAQRFLYGPPISQSCS